MKALFSILFFILISFNTYSQKIWTKVDNNSVVSISKSDRGILPDKYSSFELDYNELKNKLALAPSEKKTTDLAKSVKIDLAMPDGSVETFAFFESSCMHPELAAKFPEIQSYRGVSTTDPYKQARVEYGHTGFHASITSLEGTIYIDPIFDNPNEYYQSYFTKDQKKPEGAKAFTCGSHDHFEDISKEDLINSYNRNFNNSKNKSVPIVKTTYRMAIACTGAWGSQQGSVAQVMSKFNSSVNRLNLIFESSMAIKFELVANNEELVFFSDDDPYDNIFLESDPREGASLLGSNVRIVNETIGIDNYDIGHVYTVRCNDVGGIAALASICRGNKAAGVTCVGNSNIDFITVSTIAHEVGHQLSGGHSFNQCQGLNNRSAQSAWEPGSGSTILSYAGLCGSNNSQSRADDYYHVGNINQFYNYLAVAGCGSTESTANNSPDVFLSYRDDIHIPIGTPFELEGDAMDIDGDNMTYQWEQLDIGPSLALGQQEGNSASFRSLYPSSNKKRTFPNLFDILSGNSSQTELLPYESRDFTFWFTVRDNHPGAGSVVWDEVKFRSDANAGPFKITKPGNQFEILFPKQLYTVEWDVANTDNELINCQNVDILLSTNGGLDFDIILAENTANDGIETIELPDAEYDNVRIKIKAKDNIFFDINEKSLVIRDVSEPGFFITNTSGKIEECIPALINLDLISTSFLDFDNPINLEIVEGLPDNVPYSFGQNPLTPGESTELTLDFSQLNISDKYEFVIRATSESADTIFETINLEVTTAILDASNLVSPISGISDVEGILEFNWESVPYADSYTLEVSQSPLFEETNEIELASIQDTSIVPLNTLTNSSLYYWRIKALNGCTETASETRTIGTITKLCKTYESTDLPKNISPSGESTLTSQIEVFDVGEISEVIIPKIKGLHARPRDLRATLESPNGTLVELFDRECSSGSGFNLGFNDKSPLDFSCPLNSGNITKPESESLSILVNQNIEGNWTLILDDTKAGDGGQFQEFILELCAKGSFDNPFLINNEVLFIKTGETKRIVKSELLTEDANNNPFQLIYTLVETPKRGNLLFQGNILGIGDTFTQGNIDDGVVRYQHLGDQNETDEFVFTVIDGEGGWVDLTRFEINIDANNTTSTNEIELEEDAFQIYPNPTNNILYIYDSNQTGENWNYQLLSIDGKSHLNGRLNNRESLNVSRFAAGLYFLTLQSENQKLTYKINITE